MTDPTDPITVPRCAVTKARAAYALDLKNGWNTIDARRQIVALTDALGGVVAGDYVLVDDTDLDGLPLTAASDRWTPIAGYSRLRVTDVADPDDLDVVRVTVRRPDGGQTETVRATDLIWTL